MGCTNSVLSSNNNLKRRSSKVSIDTLESEMADHPTIKQRYGHPAYYKADGYEVGLRFRVKFNYQSFFVGTARLDNTKVTVKEHHTENCIEEEITNEIMILSKLSHSCIPKLSEIFITNISVFMVTDFIDALRLRHYVDVRTKTTTLSFNDTRSIMKSVLSATAYCHANGVIVRNLTADNIMVKKLGEGMYETKIADFSQAVEVGSTKALCDHTLFEWSDVHYMAPEALLGQEYSCSMDMWSIGVLVFLMLSAELPFASDDDKALIETIKYASYSFDGRNSVWSRVSEKAKYLVGELLVANPADRPDAKTVMKSPWIVMG